MLFLSKQKWMLAPGANSVPASPRTPGAGPRTARGAPAAPGSPQEPASDVRLLFLQRLDGGIGQRDGRLLDQLAVLGGRDRPAESDEKAHPDQATKHRA